MFWSGAREAGSSTASERSLSLCSAIAGDGSGLLGNEGRSPFERGASVGIGAGMA